MKRQALEKGRRCMDCKITVLVYIMIVMCCSNAPSLIVMGFSSNSHILCRNGGCAMSFQRYPTGLSLRQKPVNFRLYSNDNKDESDGDEVRAIPTASIEEEEEEKKRKLKEEGERRRAKMMEELEKEKRTNIGVAAFSVLAAVLNYVNQLFHPVTELQLLVEMQDQSAPVTCIGRNGKPTVVDFWAPWCGNCKSFAPTLQSIEKEYSDRVNFVMINGDEGDNWPLINRFGVDAIPHMALISADGNVETALIGPVPKSVMSNDLDVLLQNAAAQKNNDNNNNVINTEDKDTSITLPSIPTKIELPYTMFDAFQNRPELRHISFDE